MSKIVGMYEDQEQAESAVETFSKNHPDLVKAIQKDEKFKPDSETEDKEA